MKHKQQISNNYKQVKSILHAKLTDSDCIDRHFQLSNNNILMKKLANMAL
jgi:hypothetical protein